MLKKESNLLRVVHALVWGREKMSVVQGMHIENKVLVIAMLDHQLLTSCNLSFLMLESGCCGLTVQRPAVMLNGDLHV